MPTLTWLTREEDIEVSRQVPYCILEPVVIVGSNLADTKGGYQGIGAGALSYSGASCNSRLCIFEYNHENIAYFLC